MFSVFRHFMDYLGTHRVDGLRMQPLKKIKAQDTNLHYSQIVKAS